MSDPTASAKPPRRAKHLMDPDAPRVVRTAASERSLTNVQRWVMSALVVVTVLHLSVGIAIAAYFLEIPQRSAQVGLNVIAAAFGVLAIAAGFAIHKKSLVTPWLLLGLLPGIVGLVLVLR